MLAETISSKGISGVRLYISYSPGRTDGEYNILFKNGDSLYDSLMNNINDTQAYRHSMERLISIDEHYNETVCEIIKLIKTQNHRIELLYPPNNLRHAEEYLCDKAEELRKSEPQSTWRFRIYGKKRPCMTCVGRMRASKIDFFNERPGLIWWHCLEKQISLMNENGNNVVIQSFKLLLTTPSHITKRDGVIRRGYDTDSADEES